MSPTAPIQREIIDDGQIWRLRLATPKANILDQEKIELLTSFYQEAALEENLKVIILEAAGPHFSFGASVEEHLPGCYQTMIPAFHKLFFAMLEAQVPIFGAVQGQCLGGGLEVVCMAHRIFASPGAHFGQPEIVLGVFPPVASVFLTERMGRGAAEDICLSGRSIGAKEAHRLGLVDQLDEEPSIAALKWAHKYYLPRSAKSLRLAVKAVRFGMNQRFRQEIADLEEIYLEELMGTEDALEGLVAFLEKRPPVWRNQ